MFRCCGRNNRPHDMAASLCN